MQQDSVTVRSMCLDGTQNREIVLTDGTNNFFTSSTAFISFNSDLFLVSSTVISTCKSSFKCSQFGFPLFCSSCKVK